MTNNDELWMKLEAAESDDLALNGNEVSNQLRHLADNEIDSDSFAVVTENYNGREVEFERPITDLASDAAEVIDALLAERDADKKRIAELENLSNQYCLWWQRSEKNASTLEVQITELETVCAEAYQVVGALADAAGVFETSESVSKALDNLSEAKLVHSDVLPFSVETRTVNVKLPPITDAQDWLCSVEVYEAEKVHSALEDAGIKLEVRE